MAVIREFEESNDPREEGIEISEVDISPPNPEPTAERPSIEEGNLEVPSTPEVAVDAIPEVAVPAEPVEEPPSPEIRTQAPIDQPEGNLIEAIPKYETNLETNEPLNLTPINLAEQARQNYIPKGNVNLTADFETGTDLGTFQTPNEFENQDGYRARVQDSLSQLDTILQFEGREYPGYYELPPQIGEAFTSVDQGLSTVRERLNEQRILDTAKKNIQAIDVGELEELNPTRNPSRPSINSVRPLNESPGLILFNEGFSEADWDERFNFGNNSRRGTKKYDSFQDAAVDFFVGTAPLGDFPSGLIGGLSYGASLLGNVLAGGLNDVHDFVTGNKNPVGNGRSRIGQAVTEFQDYSFTNIRDEETPLGFRGTRDIPNNLLELGRRSAIWSWIAPPWLNEKAENLLESIPIPGSRWLERRRDENDGKVFDFSGLTNALEDVQLGPINPVIQPKAVELAQGALNLLVGNPAQTVEFGAGLIADTLLDPLDWITAGALGAAGRAGRHSGKVLSGADDVAATVPEQLRYVPGVGETTPLVRQADDVAGDAARRAIPDVDVPDNILRQADEGVEIPSNLQPKRPRLTPENLDEQTARVLNSRATVAQVEEVLGRNIDEGIDLVTPRRSATEALQDVLEESGESVEQLVRSIITDDFIPSQSILRQTDDLGTIIVPTIRETNSEIAARMGLNVPGISTRRIQAAAGEADPLIHYGTKPVPDIVRRTQDLDVRVLEDKVADILEVPREQLDEIIARQSEDAMDLLRRAPDEVRADLRKLIDETEAERLARRSDELLQAEQTAARRATAAAAGDTATKLPDEALRLVNEAAEAAIDHPNTATGIIQEQLRRLPKHLWTRSREGIEETAKYFRNEQVLHSLGEETGALARLFNYQADELVNNIRKVEELPDIGRKLIEQPTPFVPARGEVLQSFSDFEIPFYARPQQANFDEISGLGAEVLRNVNGKDLVEEVNSKVLFHGTRSVLPDTIDNLDPVLGASRSEIGTVIHTTSDRNVGAVYANAAAPRNAPIESAAYRVADDGFPTVEYSPRQYAETGQVYEIQPRVQAPLDVDKPLGDISKLGASAIKEVDNLPTRVRTRLSRAFTEKKTLTEAFERVNKVLSEEYGEFPERIALDIQRAVTATFRDTLGVDALVKRGADDYLEVGFTGIPGRSANTALYKADNVTKLPDVPVQKSLQPNYFRHKASELTHNLYPNSEFAKVEAAEALIRHQTDVVSTTAKRLENANRIGTEVGSTVAKQEATLKNLNEVELGESIQAKRRTWDAQNARKTDSFNSPETGLC